MLRASLAAALLGASLLTAGALRSRSAVESDAQFSDWLYYPPGAKIGIVTGARQEGFDKLNFAAHSASIMFKYAQKHGYAFYVERNMGRLGERRKYWNKVLMMHKLLREVETLVWMDPEVVIKQLEVPIEDLMSRAKCDGGNQKKWSRYLSSKPTNETFMWLNQDLGVDKYLVNANTGLVVLKRSPEAFAFLSKVWEIGNDPNAFVHHPDDNRWLRKDEKNPDHGWPFEQGAFWDVLAAEPNNFLRKTCIAHGNHFHSVRFAGYQKGNFAMNLFGGPEPLIKKEAEKARVDKGIALEVH